MIDVTVKTLDAKNHVFTVSEELTVKQFKDDIAPTINVQSELQRLIFRGRVLQDDKKLSDYNVANNTIHLVQRPADSAGNRQNDEPPPRSANADAFNIEGGPGSIIITTGTNPTPIIMGTIGVPSIDVPVSEQNVNATEIRQNSAAVRLKAGKEMVNKASQLLQSLEEDDELSQLRIQPDEESSSSSTSSTSTENSQPALAAEVEHVATLEINPTDPASLGRILSQAASIASAAAVSNAARMGPNFGWGAGLINAPNNASANASAGLEQNNGAIGAENLRELEGPRIGDMSILLQDLIDFHSRVTPFVQFLQTCLRDNQAYSPETEELQSIQYTFDTVSEILHCLGHSYHAISDILCDFSVEPNSRRLRTPVTDQQAALLRATIPISVSAFGTAVNNNTSSPTNQTPSNNNNQQQQQNTAQNQTVPPAAQATAQTVPGNLSGQPNAGPANNSGSNGVNFGGPGISINLQSNTVPDLSAILGPLFSGAMGGAIQVGAGIGPGAPLATFPVMQVQGNVRSQNPQGLQPLLQQLQSIIPQAYQQNVNNSNANMNNASTPAGGESGQSNTANSNVTGNNVQPILLPNARHEGGHMFDSLLPCCSHHPSRRRRNNQPPRSLKPPGYHKHVTVAKLATATARCADDTPDWLEGFIHIIRYSPWLETLQPVLRDMIQNYLMRGRDIKNEQHLRTCARGLAKKIIPFFMKFISSICSRNDNVSYEATFIDFFSTFLFGAIGLIVNSGGEFRTHVLLLWDDAIQKLFAVFQYCFPNKNRIPEVFAKAFVEEYLGGTSLGFRTMSEKKLTDYFTYLADQAEATKLTAEAAGIIYLAGKEENVTTAARSDLLSAVAGTSRSSINTNISVAEKKPTEGAAAVISDAFSTPVTEDMDIDELIDDIPAPFSPPQRSVNAPAEDPLGSIPDEWQKTVRQDIRRQLGMPNQAPPSSGFSLLFPHKK